MYNNIKKKQIILVRHGHTLESGNFFGSDIDIPLSPKWREYATIITRYLRLIGVKPGQIISSPAVRTRETATIIAWEYKISDIEYVDELYVWKRSKWQSNNQIYMDAIQKTSTSVDILMIVGHNDEITEFARYLSWDEVPSMKKWSLVVLALPTTMGWGSLKSGELSLLYYLTPQFLRLEELI